MGAKQHVAHYLEEEGVDGIWAIDCYVPPVLNLSVFDDTDTTRWNWNRVNHDARADLACSRRLCFKNAQSPFERLVRDDNNILHAWDSGAKCAWTEEKLEIMLTIEHGPGSAAASSSSAKRRRKNVKLGCCKDDSPRTNDRCNKMEGLLYVD